MTRAEKIILALCGIGGLLFAFALKAFGDDIIILTNETYRTVTFPAGDGANEITRTIGSRGNVVGESSTAVYVPRTVIIDDFRYVAITPSVWDDLTNTVERLKDLSTKRWDMEHKTVAGRAMWHGAATNRIVEATSVTWLYRDGYTYTEVETNAIKKVRPPTGPKRPSGEQAKPPPPNLPPRLAEKRKAMESRSGKIREINAVFGPGGKVLKVEEVK